MTQSIPATEAKGIVIQRATGQALRRAMRLLALLLAAAPSPAGLYQTQQMEIGGALELQPNGHFRYELSYGAIDEAAEGSWTSDGKMVRLTSKPMPTEPTFAVVKDSSAPKCTLAISVDWGRFGWSSPPDALVTYPDTPAELHFLQADERGALHPERCPVDSLMPLVPMFGTPGAPIKLSPSTGHNLSLRFIPNDLGHAAFRNEPLKIDGSALVMERYDAEIRFLGRRP